MSALIQINNPSNANPELLSVSAGTETDFDVDDFTSEGGLLERGYMLYGVSIELDSDMPATHSVDVDVKSWDDQDFGFTLTQKRSLWFPFIEGVPIPVGAKLSFGYFPPGPEPSGGHLPGGVVVKMVVKREPIP